MTGCRRPLWLLAFLRPDFRALCMQFENGQQQRLQDTAIDALEKLQLPTLQRRYKKL